MTAYKITKQLIKTVKQSMLCLELVTSKQTRMEQTQPLFQLFDFKEKSTHPYLDLKVDAMFAHQHLMRLTKGVAGWEVNSKTIAYELDVIKARHVVDGVGDDIDVVDEMRSWKTRNIKAQAAADNMEQAFKKSTALWSNASPKAVRDKIKISMNTKKVENCIEKPEIELVSHCKQLVTELKKLNKHLRDVVRIDSTMKDCYGKQQVINGLCGNGADTVLTILMK